ncbi:MAG: hypothetical protein H7Z37_15800 [Pyrinomonadaceae bacterium]|nr:hypothetical protein [Pyrinomonadaceae bacterium]
MNPNFDVDNKTARLVATAMHKFCAAVSETKRNGTSCTSQNQPRIDADKRG